MTHSLKPCSFFLSVGILLFLPVYGGTALPDEASYGGNALQSTARVRSPAPDSVGPSKLKDVLADINQKIAGCHSPEEKFIETIFFLQNRCLLAKDGRPHLVLGNLILAQTFLINDEALDEAIYTLGVQVLLPPSFLNVLQAEMGKLSSLTLITRTEIILRAITTARMIFPRPLMELWSAFNAEKTLETHLRTNVTLTLKALEEFSKQLQGLPREPEPDQNTNWKEELAAFTKAIEKASISPSPRSARKTLTPPPFSSVYVSRPSKTRHIPSPPSASDSEALEAFMTPLAKSSPYHTKPSRPSPLRTVEPSLSSFPQRDVGG
jgi:hypothetical protein